MDAASRRISKFMPIYFIHLIKRLREVIHSLCQLNFDAMVTVLSENNEMVRFFC